MADAPSWADQWGAGGIGAIEEEKAENKKDIDNKKNSAALSKANSIAKEGAKKLKKGTSTGIKWIKSKCQKKNPKEEDISK